MRYEGAVDLLGHHESIALDVDGIPRKVIVFHLGFVVPENVRLANSVPAPDLRQPSPPKLAVRSLAELRRKALLAAPIGADVKRREQNVRDRSAAVAAYVLRRADGKCECCNSPAPFLRRDGTPYLEAHHLRRRADEGPDHPSWVAAICATCHRRIHHGADGHAVNQDLGQMIVEMESRVTDS